MKFFKKINKADVTLKTQFMRTIISHIKISAFLLLFFGVCLINLWTLDIARKILCVIIPVIYVFYMASVGNATGMHDHKSYSKTKPFPLKGFMLALPILVLNLIFWLIFKFSWTDNASLISVLAKLVFYVWTFPFAAFAYTDKGTMQLLCHIILYILPFISMGIGYFTGYKKWEMYKLLDSITFEKKQ